MQFYEDNIRQDVGLLNQTKAFIQQLSNPFGFLNLDIEDALQKQALAEQEEIDNEKQPDHPYHS